MAGWWVGARWVGEWVGVCDKGCIVHVQWSVVHRDSGYIILGAWYMVQHIVFPVNQCWRIAIGIAVGIAP